MKKYLPLLLLVLLLGGLLRFYSITNNPPGLYLDEVAIGLNAYDILTTGKDQFGTSYPLTFASFGDYKMPVYIYLVSLAMAVLGKTELAIRFPSALLGTLTIAVIFFLMRELLRDDKKIGKYANRLALGGALIFAIQPWHIQFSRGGFETCVALFFYCLGLFLGIRYWKTKQITYLFGTMFLFCLAMYTYHSYRVSVPITLVIGLIVFIRSKFPFKHILLALGSFFLLALPLLLFSLTAHGQERLLQTSAFTEYPTKGFLQAFVNTTIFSHNYLSFFSLTFLFHYGDQMNRHQVQQFGLLYLWQLPFLIVGLYYLIKTKNRLLRFIIFLLLLVGPIPAAFARPSPHTLRFLLGSVPFAFLTVLGIFQIWMHLKKFRTLFLAGVAFVMVLGLSYFLDFYFVHYLREAQLEWGGPCKTIAHAIKERAASYDMIVIENNVGCVAEYYDFYIPNIPLTVVSPSWDKEKSAKDKKVLFVRTFYEGKQPGKLIYSVRIENLNKDIKAQFYSL